MDEQAKQDDHAGQGGSYELVNGVRVLRERTADAGPRGADPALEADAADPEALASTARAEPVPPLSTGAGGEQSEALAKTRRRSVALRG